MVSLDFIEEESELFVRVSVSAHGVPFCRQRSLGVITEIFSLTRARVTYDDTFPRN